MKNFNRQFMILAITTAGWIFSMASITFEWRLWYVDNLSLFMPDLAYVGMWKVCTYNHGSSSQRHVVCHRYTFMDTYLPYSIRLAQILLLAAIILGLLRKVQIIRTFRHIFEGKYHQDAIQKMFSTAGILNTIPGMCIAVNAIWNYHTVTNEEGIAFPPSFYQPFKPPRQDHGSAFPVAALAFFLMWLGRLSLLSFKYGPWNAKLQ